MIVDVIRGDVLESKHSYIVFAVNTSGANDAGFAGAVASRYWPELSSIGPTPVGAILEKVWPGTPVRTFFAIACHELREGGWANAPEVIQRTLDDISDRWLWMPLGPIAVVLMGAGMIGKMCGADVLSNLGAMARSRLPVVVYTL